MAECECEFALVCVYVRAIVYYFDTVASCSATLTLRSRSFALNDQNTELQTSHRRLIVFLLQFSNAQPFNAIITKKYIFPTQTNNKRRTKRVLSHINTTAAAAEAKAETEPNTTNYGSTEHIVSHPFKTQTVS